MSRRSLWAAEPTCLACPAERPSSAWRRGWRGPYCGPCAHRWDYHGRPAGGPPPAPSWPTGPRAGRVEDYGELRAMGVSREEAAARVGGVCSRTVERYEAALRDMDTGRAAA